MSLSVRHQPWSVIQSRLATGLLVPELIPGEPRISIQVEPDNTLAMLVFAPEHEEEDLPRFAALDCHRLGSGEQSRVRIACSSEDVLPQFYAATCKMADRIQLEGMRVDDAIRATAEELLRMLAVASLMSTERQIGLWGELHALRYLAHRHDWDTALNSWSHFHGWNEEHDFVLADVDLEIKTTRKETRTHAVGRSQLDPKPGRRLLLCSIQVTGGGGSAAVSLQQMIESLRKDVPHSCRRKVDLALSHAGWLDDRADSYSRTRWVLRSLPLVIDAVHLPRLLPHGPTPERIVDFTFSLDLSRMENRQEKDWVWR